MWAGECGGGGLYWLVSSLLAGADLLCVASVQFCGGEPERIWKKKWISTLTLEELKVLFFGCGDGRKWPSLTS